MKRSAEVAFVQEEFPVTPQPVLPHLQTIPNAASVPAIKSPTTRKTPRRLPRGSTTLRRGPTYLERDEAERAKAAAAAHWILNNRSPDVPQPVQLPQKRQRSSNALALRLGPSAAFHDPPATLVVPPAVSKAHQRSNVIRRAKPFVELNLPEEVIHPVPPQKRQKTCTSCGSKVDENGNAIFATSLDTTHGPMVNTISFSQAFIETSLRILARLGLGRLMPSSLSDANPPAQPETKAALPHLTQIDGDVEMHDATPTLNASPTNREIFKPQAIPYDACPVPSAYTPEQWARFSVHQELASSRYTDQTRLNRIARKAWEDSGYQASANYRCHPVRAMTRSRLSEEIFPQEEESSLDLLTSHSSLASITSTMSIDSMDQLPSSPVPVNATLQPTEDIQFFPTSNRDIDHAVRSATTSVVENERARWNFYPMFTGKTPGPEKHDTLRKTTLLSNWGHWLHRQNIWDLLWDRHMDAVMVWHNNYPAMPLPPPSPFVVALRGDQRKQTVNKAGEHYDYEDMEMVF